VLTEYDSPEVDLAEDIVERIEQILRSNEKVEKPMVEKRS
jgi:hypothetical protein